MRIGHQVMQNSLLLVSETLESVAQVEYNMLFK